MSEQYPNAIEDHPRQDEVERIWRELDRCRPDEALGDGDAVIIEAEFPLPLCMLSDVLVPAVFLEDRSEDQIAFGLAYAACLSVGLQYIEDAVSLMKGPINELDESDSFLAMPAATIFGTIGGLVGGLVGIWRGLTRFAARERAAIETAVKWTHEAGFDPNQAVRMFMGLAGWFEEHKPESKPQEPGIGAVAAAFVAAPFLGAVAAVAKDDPPMTAAADRAAAVRAACVALGVHR